MKILGISGLDNSLSFKQAHWPHLQEREYRMCQGYDAAAALVVDGVVVAAAAEERFDRRKHSAAFPIHAVRYCMSEAGIALEEVDELAHCFDYTPYRAAFMPDPVARQRYQQVYSKEALLARVSRHLPGFSHDRVRAVNHHLSHAASAYLTSGWDDCLVIVIDGMGEVHGISVYQGRGGRLDRIAQMSALDSIGIFYSLVTLHLGFDFNADEYKIMGLAPYGDPRRFAAFFDEAVELCRDGSIRISPLRLNRTRDERENYLATRRYLAEHLGPERCPDAELTETHRDIAAGLQACLDKTLLHICRHFADKTGLGRLALAGGVALNCTANGALLQSGLFDEIYVQPAAGDDGAALGAALYRAGRHERIPTTRFQVPYLGPMPSPQDVRSALRQFAADIVATPFDTLEETCLAASQCIADGEVIGWYRGRMEFGPRALGHRSILADPGRADMRDRINAMVKKREAFRPFAPAVSVEQVHQWFAVPPMTELPYMIMTVNVRDEFQRALPAITHVNGSARVQTVSPHDDAAFHSLLRAVGKATGREMVLNTSFNVKGQPIVNTPVEAIATFLSTGIDALFIENILIRRRSPRPSSSVPPSHPS